MNNNTNGIKKKACINCGQVKLENKCNFEYRSETGKYRNSCNDCRRKKDKNKVRVRNTLESVKEAFAKRGYILLDDKYINTKTPMKYRCPKHPDKELYMIYSNFMQGNKCPYCSKRKVDFEDIKKEFKDRGYELLTDHFINNRQKLKYRCLKHPEEIRTIDYSHFNSGRGCYECGVEKNTGKNHPLWNGGSNKLSIYLREKVREWNKKSLEDNDYTCFVTGRKGKLEVHHSIPFHKLRDETLKELSLNQRATVGEYTELELKKVTNLFLEKHENISPTVMLKEVHKLFHKTYGINTNYYDVYEFRERYLKGEFCEVVKETEQLKLIL